MRVGGTGGSAWGPLAISSAQLGCSKALSTQLWGEVTASFAGPRAVGSLRVVLLASGLQRGRSGRRQQRQRQRWKAASSSGALADRAAGTAKAGDLGREQGRGGAGLARQRPPISTSCSLPVAPTKSLEEGRLLGKSRASSTTEGSGTVWQCRPGCLTCMSD